MGFIDYWCFNCERDKHEDCPIVAESMTYDVKDDKYPIEWRYNDDDEPICTEFIPLGDPAPAMKRDRDTKTVDMFGDGE